MQVDPKMMKEELELASVKGVVLAEEKTVFMTGPRKKKKAMMVMSAVAWNNLESGGRLDATMVLHLSTWMIGFAHNNGGSFCF